ncbi:MAG: hypothetical protein EA364_16045 [Balneolaceae bacterium]|nr:MAG: hypothetical protein EA364_16045 [Balneolaceae bacterium]
MKKYLYTAIVCFVILALSGTGLHAQTPGEYEFRVAVRMDGAAYVYHSGTPPLGYSINIYRRDSPDGEFVLLTDKPISGAANERQLRSRLGSLYWDLRNRLTTTDTNADILFTLRADRVAGLLTGFLYPEVAEALGRLFIDRSAPAGRRVTYRLELLDEFEEPSGEVYDHDVTLTPALPASPRNLRAEHDSRFITLSWDYPPNRQGEDDKVIRFGVYQIGTDDSRILLNRDVIIRDENISVYRFEHAVPETGRNYRYVVAVVDITGQQSPDSNMLDYRVTENRAPAFINGLVALLNDDQTVTLSWPVSVDPAATGYHVYRGTTTEEDAESVRLTDIPLGLMQTTWQDTGTAHPGTPRFLAYRITVTGSEGRESEMSNAATVNLPNLTPPPPAVGIRAEYADNGTVVLNWDAPAAMDPDFKTWILMRRSLDRRAAPVPTRINEGDVTGTRFVDRGPTGAGFIEGMEYEFSVASSDSARNTSDPVFVRLMIPKTTPPDAPYGFRARNEEGFRVVLNWTPPADLTVASYTIERRDEGRTGPVQFDVPAGTLSYRDESVESGRTYLYRIRAADRFGNLSEFTPDDRVEVRHFILPRTVRNVRAEAIEGAAGVRVWWEPVPDADLAGYRVFRSEIATGVFEEITPEMIGTGVTVFTDPEGTAGNWYRVRAYNTSGNESRQGDPAQARTESGGN